MLVTLTNILLMAHIAAGFLSLAVGLVALSVPKVTRTHPRFGRIFVWLIVFVSISGTILLADPAFGAIQLLAFSDREGLGEVLQSAEYFEVLFLWLTVATLYSTLTGVRVWSRMNASQDDRMAAGWPDWTMAVAAVPMSIMFLGIGIVDLRHGERMGTEFVFFSLSLLGIAAFDLATFVTRPSITRFPWWMVHMIKMVLAVGSVAYAVYLRHFLQLPEVLQVRFFVLYLAIPLIALFLWRYRRQWRSGPTAPNPVTIEHST